MDSIEEARKREARQQWLMLPVAAVWTVICIGIYIVLIVEDITIFGVTYYGIAKAVWFLNLVFLGGLSLILATLSLSVLIMLGLIAEKLSIKMHTWLPLLLSSGILVLGFAFLSLARRANDTISSNIRAINSWYYGIVGDSSVITFLVELGSVLLSVFLAGFMMSLLTLAASLPFHAKNIANEIHTINE